MKKKGFTLIEMLIYIGIGTMIISILGTVLVKEYSYMKSEAKEYIYSHNSLNAFSYIESVVNDPRVEEVIIVKDALQITINNGEKRIIKKRGNKLQIINSKPPPNTILEKIHKIVFEKNKEILKITLWHDEKYKEEKTICIKKEVTY